MIAQSGRRRIANININKDGADDDCKLDRPPPFCPKASVANGRPSPFDCRASPGALCSILMSSIKN
jgi:hypothetical protein